MCTYFYWHRYVYIVVGMSFYQSLDISVITIIVHQPLEVFKYFAACAFNGFKVRFDEFEISVWIFGWAIPRCEKARDFAIN